MLKKELTSKLANLLQDFSLCVYSFWDKDLIFNCFKQNGVDILKCRGQAYDSMSVISDSQNGLQAQILRIEEYAKYTYCAARNLKFVLNDAVNGFPEADKFV